jgi:hypothetical protein
MRLFLGIFRWVLRYLALSVHFPDNKAFSCLKFKPIQLELGWPFLRCSSSISKFSSSKLRLFDEFFLE